MPISRSPAASLTGLRRQKVHLLLDRVVLTDSQNVLVVSVGFRRRSIPLVWRILSHAGSSRLRDQQQLLRAAATLLPPSVRMTVHADSEFRSQVLFDWLRRRRWNAIVGIRGNVHITTDPAKLGQPLSSWLPHRESVAYLNAVWLAEERCGSRNVLARWDTSDRGELICYAVMTNLSATWQTYRVGSRRMGSRRCFGIGKAGALSWARLRSPITSALSG